MSWAPTDSEQLFPAVKSGFLTVLVVWLVALTLVPFRIAEAQQPKKVARVGFLLPISASLYASRIEAFRQGLHDLGYVEGTREVNAVSLRKVFYLHGALTRFNNVNFPACIAAVGGGRPRPQYRRILRSACR